jgi:hypothetical protein
MKRSQSGISMLGFIMILAVVGVSVYVGMKVIPMYTEFYAVKKSLEGVALEPGVNNAPPDRLKTMFFRRLDVNYSENVKPENVSIERMEGGWHMTVSYEVRRPMIANLDVVGNFVAEKDMTHGGPAD